MCHMCEEAHGDQKVALGPLKLELQVLVELSHVSAGNWLSGLWEELEVLC